MRARFWGVRGSIAVPGPTTNRYGGNTSCVEIDVEGMDPIIIDAGTGIRRLGKELAGGPFGSGNGTAHLLISHTHWDHIQGLPFFAPLYTRGNRLHVYARRRDTHLRAVFASQTESPYFPVPLDELRADVTFHELGDSQSFAIGPAQVRCTRLNHPWIALAFRIEHGGRSIVYASDTAPFRDILFEHEFIGQPPAPGAPLDPAEAAALSVMRQALVDLCRGADLLIYDTQFTPAEYRQKPHWGHSTPDDAIAIAREAEVGTLALYHHAPQRTDDEQDAILAACRAAVVGTRLRLVAAYEGLEVDLGSEVGR
ncbi:MAG TPA: MBL fold metallo-hydrolase [Kofleriaceae bacterium]|nr:MBL fold metallo-hydrolase [Kofleriaceae bacterium]